MRHVKMSSKALAALLALLMVLSTVIALPVAAADAVSTEKVLWSLDLSSVGEKDAAATDEYLVANKGFAVSLVSSASAYSQGAENVANSIDADGFYKITTAHSGIDGNKRGETEVPTDFFNLFYGLYDGYSMDGASYNWTFDLRFDKSSQYSRNDNAGFTYTAADSTAYTTLYTDASGWSFFAARAAGNYDSIFRIAKVDGVDYLYAESAALEVTNENYKEVGNVYFKNADGEKVYVAEDNGTITESGLSIANVVDVNNAYALTVGETYAIRVRFDVETVPATGKVAMKAHLYVKGANDAAETYLGYADWTLNPAKAGAFDYSIRFTDGAGLVSVGNMKVTDADNNKTLLWSANLNKWGTTGAHSGSGSVTKANLVAALENTMAIASALDANGAVSATTISGNATITGGLLRAGSNATRLVGTDETNPFFGLLTGTFTRDGETVERAFVEFDYKFGSANTTTGRNDTSTTVAGSTVTAVTDYGDNGGANWHFRLHSASTTSYIFRVSANNYLYTSDIEKSVTTTATGVDGYVYYTDATYGTVYFDADGYRYYMNEGEKTYIDDTAAEAPTVSGMSLNYSLDPAKVDRAYKVTEDALYRIGLDIQSSTSAAGLVTIKYTLYIKEAGAENWEKCVGTSTQYWRLPTHSSYNAANQYITLAGSNHIYFGGDMVAYTYTCGGGKHMPGMFVSETKVSDTGVVYSEVGCSYCGELEVTRDGVVYTSAEVDNGCEGSYTLWTAADGSGKTFITDVVAANHNYSTTSGKCSVCGEYSYMPGVATTGNTTLAIADGLDNAPSYNSATQQVEAPNGGMIMNFVDTNGNPRSPFVASVTFCLDEAIVNNETATSAWPLLSYQMVDASGNSFASLASLTVANDKPILTVGSGTDSVAELAYGTWYTVETAVIPGDDDTDDTSTVMVYLNGEYVGATIASGARTGELTAARVRVGVQTSTAPYRFAYKVSNIGFYQTDLAGLYDLNASNTLFSLQYDRFQSTSGMATSANIFGSFLNSFKSTNSGNSIVDGKYGIITGTGYKTIVTSTLVGDEEFNLSDKKYEIKMQFAVPNTDGDDEDTNPDALKSGGANLVRLSKYDDNIKAEIVSYSSRGQLRGKTASNGLLYLYDANDQAINITCDFDANNVPSKITDLRVVVDEKNNTYSIYVDGAVAYYRDSANDNALTPFVDMPMPYSKGAVTSEVSSYGEITKAMAEAAGYTGTYQYVRLFRDISTVAIEEVAITVIPDNDVELVGTQVKTADQTTTGGFDLRFIFGIDDLYVDGVNFSVKAYKNGVLVGEKAADTVNTVYSAVNADGSTFSAYECSEGDYFALLKITGIEETSANDIYSFEITASTVDKNGNSVSQSTYTVACNGLGGNVLTSGK